jgi:hypothetical protein
MNNIFRLQNIKISHIERQYQSIEIMAHRCFFVTAKSTREKQIEKKKKKKIRKQTKQKFNQNKQSYQTKLNKMQNIMLKRQTKEKKNHKKVIPNYRDLRLNNIATLCKFHLQPL